MAAHQSTSLPLTLHLTNSSRRPASFHSADDDKSKLFSAPHLALAFAQNAQAQLPHPSMHCFRPLPRYARFSLSNVHCTDRAANVADLNMNELLQTFMAETYQLKEKTKLCTNAFFCLTRMHESL
jgi:hypothetical protein